MRSFWNKLVVKARTGAQERRALAVPRDISKSVEAYRAILLEMRDILQRNSFVAESQFVVDALSALEADSPEFVRLVTGRGMWGGSGSVSDCLFEANARDNREQAGLDDSRMVALLAQLVRRLVADGMSNPRIESLGEVYERATRCRSTAGE